MRKGSKHTEEAKEKMSLVRKGRKLSEEWKRRIGDSVRGNPSSRGFLGKHHTEESKAKIRKGNRGKERSEETRKRISIARQHQIFTKETREKMSQSTKMSWSNPAYAKKVFSVKKPNVFEKNFDKFLQQLLPNEYKYVGAGEFILGGKCPDFMNVNGKKKLIEVYGDYWHRNDNPQDRIDYFKQFGFACLVIWQHELKRIGFVKMKVLKFNNGRVGKE